MYDIKPEIYDLLATIADIEVVQGWPEKETKDLPVVSFYEAENSVSRNTLEGESISRIALQIDVWAKTSAVRDSVTSQVNAKMSTLNFVREMAYDLADRIGMQVIKRKTMRYAVYLDIKTMKLYRNPMK